MKFYAINQNNSGGYFIRNDDVDQIICIQSNSPELAEEKLFKITSNYSEYCECCGERWYISLDHSDGFDFIHDSYGGNVESHCYESSRYRKFIIIYYANGDKKKFNTETKSFTDLGKWI